MKDILKSEVTIVLPESQLIIKYIIKKARYRIKRLLSLKI